MGEFSEHLTNPRSTLDSLLNPKVVALPPHVQAVFVQNIVKLYASILVKAEAEVKGECVCVCVCVCILMCRSLTSLHEQYKFLRNYVSLVKCV